MTLVGPRAPGLAGAVAAGYARALLGVVLTEQEQIRRPRCTPGTRAESARCRPARPASGRCSPTPRSGSASATSPAAS